MKTVHILDQGFALCMFSTNIPAQWPEDNVWMDLVLFKQSRWESARAMIENRLGPCEICTRCKELGDEI